MRPNIPIVAILIMCSTALSTIDIADGKSNDTIEQTTERILSRRRRYLIFPEGSSLQLVYDSVITIPDYTIYVLTGVTVALAWGLPFKPFYPDEELPSQYESGHLPLLGRTDENITDNQYVDTKKAKGKNGKNKTLTKTLPATTPAPIYAVRTKENLLQLFQNIHQSHPNRYNSLSYGPGQQHESRQPFYQRPHQPQYRPHNSIQYDYSHRNNSRLSNSYYSGQSNFVRAPMLPNRTRAQSIYGPLLSSAAEHATRKKYDYASYINNGLNAVDEEPPPFNSRPPPARAPSTKYPPNPYAEFIKYLTQTYQRPWHATEWQQKQSNKPTTKESAKTKTRTTAPANDGKSRRPEFKPIIRKLHTIYPAMGKRSIVDHTATYEEKFYLDHHRNTRHELFGLIEKYVSAKGFNGTACVLKTLCEIGQRRDDQEPGSFLSEIVRVIFSLPKAQLKPVTRALHENYDIAHNHVANCDEQFKECTESIWNSGFLLEIVK